MQYPVASMACGGAPDVPVVAAAGAQMRQLRDLFVDGAEGLAGNTVWKNTRVPLLDQNNVRDHRREDDAADLQPYH